MKKITKLILLTSALTQLSYTPSFAKDDIEIEFELGPRNHILVPVDINNRQGKIFALDTGAGYTTLNNNRINDLELDESRFESIMVGRAYGNVRTDLAPLENVRFAGNDSSGIKAILTDLSDVEKGLMVLDGVLGHDVFGKYDLEIDYPNSKLILKQQVKGRACSNVEGDKFRFVAGKLIKFNVSIKGNVYPAVLDTGAAYSAMNSATANDLIPGAVEKIKKAMEAHGRPEDPDGGEFYVGPIGLSEISLGQSPTPLEKPFNVIDVPAFKYFDMVDKPGLLIGGDILKSKNVKVFYGCQKIDIS